MTEMPAKTLTTVQQRHSLSGSKQSKRPSKSIRNVLAKPYADFWPVADADAELQLEELLRKTLPASRKKPLSPEVKEQLCKLKKNERREQRKKLLQSVCDGVEENRQYLVLGVNDVSRALEKDTLVSLMISNEADPPILTRHLATLAAVRKIPFVVLQNLKRYTRDGLGFNSLSVGLKRNVSEDERNPYHNLHKKIVDLCELTAKTTIPEHRQEIPASDLIEAPLKTAARDVKKICSMLHLTRSSRLTRVFVPGEDKKNMDSSNFLNFISLSGSSESLPTIPSTRLKTEILGLSSVPDNESFLQKDKDKKLPLALSQSQQQSLLVETDPFMPVTSSPSQTESQTKCGSKPAQERYFSKLAPLKVKRIQSNALKTKKNKKIKK